MWVFEAGAGDHADDVGVGGEAAFASGSQGTGEGDGSGGFRKKISGRSFLSLLYRLDLGHDLQQLGTGNHAGNVLNVVGGDFA